MGISRAVGFGRAGVLAALIVIPPPTGALHAQAPDPRANEDGARLEEKLVLIVDQAQTTTSAARLTELLEDEGVAQEQALGRAASLLGETQIEATAR